MKKAKLIDDLQHYLQDLEEILPDEEEEFLHSKTIQYSVSMLLMNIINCCLDLGSEVVNIKQLGYPENYRDIFSLLEKKSIISSAMAKQLKNMVGLRNLLAHEYGEIEFSLLYEQAKDMQLVDKFISIMVKHLD
jgi:uncharacterized protein YutE (UPF0331/DUF86 family)